MLPIKSSFPFIYNPSLLSIDEILSSFVVRLNEFNEIHEAIQNDPMEKPPQHFLIQGQRGYGKTTLLLRLYFAIKNDEKLNSWLIPVMFEEEQYGVNTLAKLWEKIIELLNENENDMIVELNQVDAIYETESPEDGLFKYLEDVLIKHQKKIVLLIDNFGEIIEKFSRKENQRLREILITSNLIRVIGTSSTILEFYYNYKEPLFDFFKIINLNELNKDETLLLLHNLSEIYAATEIKNILQNQPERVDALRKLTGGVPRTILLLFEIFIDDLNGNSFRDLEMILDRVTPLYKHRMDSLSPQQQSIVAAIAQNWDAISTKDISKKVRIASKAVSAQLNQLEKNQLIEKIVTSTKNHLYQIKERFFNIYYLMRLGKRDTRNKVLWLIKFFEIWCCPKDLVERVKKQIEALRNDRLYDKYAFYISQALLHTDIPFELQHELISETRNYLNQQKSEFVRNLDGSVFEIYHEVIGDIKQNNVELAKNKLRKLGKNESDIALFFGDVSRFEQKEIERAAGFYKKSIQMGNVTAILNLADLFRCEFKDIENAEKYYLMAVEKNDSDAMFNLANLYRREFKDIEKAKDYYLMAANKGHVSAMFNIANLFREELKNYDKAKEFYLLAVNKGHVKAMNNLANLNRLEYKNYEEAIKYYLMAINRGHVKAMRNLAHLYRNERKDLEKAKEYYLMAVDNGDIDAMISVATLYRFEFHDVEAAKKYYLLAIERGNVGAMIELANLYMIECKDPEMAKRYCVMAAEKNSVEAMLNLAILFQTEFNDIKKAKEYYLMAVEKGNVVAMFNLAMLFFNEYHDTEKAKEYYLMAANLGDADAMNNLAWLYYSLKEKRGEALQLQRNAYQINPSINFAHTLIVLLLWNDEVEEAMRVYRDKFDNEDAQKKVNQLMSSLLILFLAKKQLNFVHSIFRENKYELKDKYKPIYFALLFLLGRGYEDEFKKMGNELKETVQEILKEIETSSI